MTAARRPLPYAAAAVAGVAGVAVAGAALLAAGCRRDRGSAATDAGRAQPALSSATHAGGGTSRDDDGLGDAPRAFAGSLGGEGPLRLAVVPEGDTVFAWVLPRDGAAARAFRGPRGSLPVRLQEVTRAKGGGAVLTLTAKGSGESVEGRWQEGGKEKPFTASAARPLEGEPEGKGGFAGFVGDTMRIRAQLTRTGPRLEGYYRYSRSADDLNLAGTVDETTGAFTLTEKDRKGETTGQLRGVFLAPGAAFGSWTSPPQDRRFPFSLEHAPELPRTRELAAGVRVVPQELFQTTTPACALEVEYTFPQLRGLADKSAEAKLNDALKALVVGKPADRNELCATATEDRPYLEQGSYQVTASSPHAVAIRASGYMYTGGAHGSSWVRCVVADLAQGALVEPKGRVNDGARAQLRARVNQELRREHKTAKLSEAGFFDDDVPLTRDTELCLERAKLVVEFQPYEVAPYVMGAPSVALPAEEARALFGGDALLAGLLR